MRDELLPPPPEPDEVDGVEILPPSQAVQMNGHKVLEEIELNAEGNPIATVENLKRVCANRSVTLRYNVIKKQEEIIIPGEDFSVDNMLNASYARVVSFCKEVNMPTQSVKDYLTYLTDKNPFNPVVSWIMSKPWDGTSRAQSFYDTVSSKDKKLKEIMLRRWMVSAIAAAFNPTGVSAHGVLVFRGEQYLGKTSWFKKLAPSYLEVIKDGYILRLDNKDSVFQCLSHWIVELGELEATFRKSDIAQLKAFITSDRDIVRRPYAVKESFYARRTVFFASVNQKEFLFDETGNRRFWVIETDALDYNHNLDMQQVWAEFYHMYSSGEPWVMQSDEIANVNINNEEFMGADYHDELVMRKYDWDSLPYGGGDWRTVTEISIALGLQNPKQNELNRLSKALRKWNGDKTKRGSGGTRLLLVPRERLSSEY